MSSNIVEQHIPSHPPLEILEASTRCNLFPMKSYPISSFSSAGCRCCNLHQCRDGDEVWSFLCPIQQWSDFDNRTGPRTSLKFLNDLWRWPEHVILYKMRNLCNWKLCRILDIYIFHYISNNFSKESKDRYTIYIYIYVFTTYIYIHIRIYNVYIYIYICSISRKHLHVFLVPFPPKKLWWKSSQEKAIPRPCPPVTSLVFCGLHQAPTLGFFVDFSRLKSWWRFFSTTKITWAMKSKTRVV